MNKVLKALVYSDILFISGFGFITPVFAIFLTDRIRGGSVEVVGFAAAIVWIVQSLALVPFSKFVDKNKKDVDDFWFMVFGNVLGSVAAFGYVFATLPWHIYVLQAVYAIGLAMNIAGYQGVFTRHIDKGKESYQWGLRAALVGFGTGIAGALGGIFYERFGADLLFVTVGILAALGALSLLTIFKTIIVKDKEKKL
ncbi:MAG: MFS transporter [Candidatus Paceibacterota bacterium]|jgi:predicted MFS family arabinose efflux permease